MLPLRKKLSFLLSSLTPPHGSLSAILRLSTLPTQNPTPKSSFMEKYLITSCGFPSDKAIKVSKQLTHIKSSSKADSVLQFLRQCGFSDTQIISLTSMGPKILCANVEKTLKPKFRDLQGMGLSQSELIQLVTSCPAVLQYRDLRPKMELWRSLSISNKDLLKAIKRDHFIFSASFTGRVMPNISLLRECGIPDARIGKMIVNMPTFIGRSPDSIQAMIRRAEELGASRGSGMFLKILTIARNFSRTTFDAKLNFLKGLGWSEADISATIRKQPGLFHLSEKNIHDKVEFLTREAECKLSFIARRPVLLMYSMEKRLVPRFSVLRVLKIEGLYEGRRGLSTMLKLSEKKFL